jgi:nucleotide-binding universal stress UspA family protein
MSEHGPIVVPLDGSALAEAAVAVGAALAGRMGAELHLVHVELPVTPDPIYVEGLPVIDEHMRPLRRRHEEAYLEGARTRLAAGARVVTRVVTGGAAAPALANYARESGGQLVVLSTHGRGGFERAWLGSVTDEMIRLSRVPLLVLKPGTPPVGGFRRILVPLDGSPLAEAILEHAARIARLDPEAELVLLEVQPRLPPAVRAQQSMLMQLAGEDDPGPAQEAAAREYLDATLSRLSREGVRARTRFERADNVAVSILETAAAESADLLALCTHGRTGLARLALGSVADKLVRASTLPVLLFRPLP